MREESKEMDIWSIHTYGHYFRGCWSPCPDTENAEAVLHGGPFHDNGHLPFLLDWSLTRAHEVI